MTNKIKIDIISDVVCPWCAVGYKRLEQAINELGIEDKVALEWKPFELNPSIQSEGENLIEHLMRKYGLNTKQVEEFQTNIIKSGKELDFVFDYFKEMRVVNTFEAHILLTFAKDFHKQKELKIRLMEAYFSQRKDISNTDVLLDIVQEVGLDKHKAQILLDDEKFKRQIQAEEKYILNQGISSVPTMIFNGKETYNGAHPVETYKQILKELINEH